MKRTYLRRQNEHVNDVGQQHTHQAERCEWKTFELIYFYSFLWRWDLSHSSNVLRYFTFTLSLSLWIWILFNDRMMIKNNIWDNFKILSNKSLLSLFLSNSLTPPLSSKICVKKHFETPKTPKLPPYTIPKSQNRHRFKNRI